LKKDETPSSTSLLEKMASVTKLPEPTGAEILKTIEAEEIRELLEATNGR